MTSFRIGLRPDERPGEDRPDADGRGEDGRGEDGRRAGAPAGLHVAYLVNTYPKVSHSFIRREILALERLGARVERIAFRGWDAEVVDEEDRAERLRTRHLLADGAGPLVGALARVAATRPRRFLAALQAALAMGRRSTRPLPYHLVYLAHACRILGWLEGSGVTHLHAHFGTNSAETALLVRLLGGPPYSFTAHGADEADDAPRLALGRKIAGAKFVVGVSAYTRSQLLRQAAPEDWPKIRVVHCGVDDAFFAGPRSDPPAAPAFLSIGRFSGEKGQLVLVEAFARVAGLLPEARLTLAGDGELRPALEARIGALGLGARVRITGWISSAEVRAELIAARVLVQPSFQEGLPVVIMEAMALGRPVISTFVAGIPELVLPGETGWLAPAGEIEALAAAMARAAAAPAAEMRRMSAAARARALARHGAEGEAKKLARLFAAADPADP
jgi:glycosyltransferase involved in cell wall biosynthesis